MAPACGNSPDRYGPLADLLTSAIYIRRAFVHATRESTL